MTIDAMVDEIIQREGAKDTDNPNDRGGRTKYGISQKWDPEAWKNGPPTLDEARAIYKQKYFDGPGITKLTPDYIMSQVADFGVNSGPVVAVQKLQKVLGLEPDGKIGPATLLSLANRNPLQVNNLLVNERVLMMVRITQKRPANLEFLFGWVTRAQSFYRF